MKNMLKEIMEERRKTVTQLKAIVPVESWEMMPGFAKKTVSLTKSLQQKTGTGIIAEFKRASPSKGVINNRVDVAEVTAGYEMHGAAALSVLTEPSFFEGDNDDLLLAAKTAGIPVLRKDFIFDTYQITESKGLGADVILLIAACLTPAEVKSLAAFARRLHLDVILEIHDAAELGHICDETEIIGINNRNLKTFEVDINRSIELAGNIPTGKLKIAESGIQDTDTVLRLADAGFSGFLLGEIFMKATDPIRAFASFNTELTGRMKRNQRL